MSDDLLPVEDGDSYKPSYDGRMMYYDVIKKFLLAQKVSALNGDVNQWYRGLRILYNMCQAYVSPEDRAAIKKELNRIRLEIGQLGTARTDKHRGFIIGAVEEDLLELEEQLHTAARAMFLPIKAEDKTGWDDEEFLRGSDA